MKSKTSPKTQGDPLYDDGATSAADLAILIENGDGDAALNARVQTLNRANYLHVLRVVRQLDGALNAYAMSWQNAQFWGQGQDFPEV